MPIPIDELTVAVERYAAPLPQSVRAEFIRAVCVELGKVAEIGPGAIARAVQAIQPKYLDQQAVGSGPRTPGAKYARPLWTIKRGKLKAGP